MSNPSEELQMAYEFAIGVLIDCARKVVVFDGTDRKSLDDLREAVLKFGEVNDLIARFFSES
jgi:hypothetical protein